MSPEQETMLINALERVTEHLNNASEALNRIAITLAKIEKNGITCYNTDV